MTAGSQHDGETLGIDAQAEQAALGLFNQAHPEYANTATLDALRASDFARLDRRSMSTSTTLALGCTPIRTYRARRASSRPVFGNPHSGSPSSGMTTQLVERTRQRVLDRFNAPPDTTPPSSRRTPPPRSSRWARRIRSRQAAALLTFDNHNSVNGIREFARAKGAAWPTRR